MSNDKWACLALRIKDAKKELEAGKIIPAYQSLEKLEKFLNEYWEVDLHNGKVEKI